MLLQDVSIFGTVFGLQNFIRLVALRMKEMVIVWNGSFHKLINDTALVLCLLVHNDSSFLRMLYNCPANSSSGDFLRGCSGDCRQCGPQCFSSAGHRSHGTPLPLID